MATATTVRRGDSGDSVFTVHTEDFKRHVKAFARRYGLNVGKILRWQFGIWGEDLIRRTDPLGTSERTKRLISRAVKSDVMKLFRVFKPSYEWWEMDPRKSGATGIAVEIADLSGARHPEAGGRKVVYGVEKHLFRPDATIGTMRRHHLRFRNAQSGHVPKTDEWATVGRWKFLDKMHVRPRTMDDYVRWALGHVGKVKAGWLPMCTKFKGRPPPEWIARHGQRYGTVTDNLRDTGQGHLDAENKVSYASQMCRVRTLASTAKAREKAIQKLIDGDIEKTWKKIHRAQKKGLL
jgi:hypothetical protein